MINFLLNFLKCFKFYLTLYKYIKLLLLNLYKGYINSLVSKLFLELK